MKKVKTALLLRKIQILSKENGFYAENEKTLVGFSGGADSVVLMHALSGFLGNDRVCAVHINHMLRGADADADEEFCRAFCEKENIPFRAVRIDVAALCGGKGFEEAARDVRYRVFEETAAAFGCSTVSLAHTASDNLETMLFHLCRGAGAAGLSGIPPQRTLGNVRVVRPLLDATREDILAYAEENGLSYQTDATNADTAYTRNFIRAEIVPLLKKVNASAEENARYAADAIREMRDLTDETAERFLRENDPLTVSSLETLAPPILHAVLTKAYQNAGGGTLPRSQADALSALIREHKTGASVSLSGGITAKIDGAFLRFSTEAVENHAFDGAIPLVFGENRLSDFQYIYIGTAPTRCFRFSASAEITERSLPTLFARARREGEAYRFGGMTRKLKKLLCGKSMLEKNRPLICDGDGIVWHPDFPVADGKAGILSIYYIET